MFQIKKTFIKERYPCEVVLVDELYLMINHD